MDRTQFDRFFDGIGLGFLVSAGGWIAVIGTINRDVDTLSFVALWLPVVGFAVLGFALHGSGLLGAVLGAAIAVLFVFQIVPSVNPDLGEAGADSIAWGIPVELIVLMVPAGLIGWIVAQAWPGIRPGPGTATNRSESSRDDQTRDEAGPAEDIR